jgi:hypothetical protein
VTNPDWINAGVMERPGLGLAGCRWHVNSVRPEVGK